MSRKLGKLPARPDAVSFKFGAIFNAEALPTPPAHFGRYNLPVAWQVFGNDKFSDCVFAGAAHEVMIWRNEVGESVAFTDQAVLYDYGAVTGFDPDKPETDQGTDMTEAASYRRKTGIVDAIGQRHKVDAYIGLRPRDLEQLAQATFLFKAVGVGVMMPASADKQFEDQVPWSVVDGDEIVGGHYIPCVGINGAGNFLFLTWGRLHAATPEWVKKYMDEGIAYVSLEELNAKGLSREGYNADLLRKYLAALAA